MPPRLGGLRHVQANNGHRAARLPVYDFLLPWAANLEGLGGFWSSNPRTRTRGTATAASYVPSPRDDDPADEGWTASYRPPETESHLTTLESSPFGLERGGGTEPANAAAGPSRSRPAPSLPLKTTSHRDIRKVETESPPPTLMPYRRWLITSFFRTTTASLPVPILTPTSPHLPPSVDRSRPQTPPNRYTPSPPHRIAQITQASKSVRNRTISPPQPTHISRSLRTTLSRPNPPDPRHLLTQLRHEPSRLSRDDGELLMSYSRRMSDARTERWTKDLMGRMRLAPVEWVKVVWGKPAFRAAGRSVRPGEPIVQRSTASQGPAPNSPVPPSHPVPEAIHAAEPAFPADMEEAGPSVTPPKRRRPRLLSLGLNTWAVRSWPPNSNLTLPCTSQQFLQYTHYRLALSDAPRPQLAEMLDALGSFLPAHEPQDALDVLHLFLAYPSRPARAPSWSSSISPPGQSGHHDPPQNSEAFSLSLLNEFVARYPAISPTRQTLHLIITSCLGSGSHRTRTRSPSDVNESVSQTSAGGLIDSTDALVIIRDFAPRWNITPGLATLRHLLRYAVRKDIVDLAEYAWNAWSDECARLQSLRDREEATGGGTSTPSPSTSHIPSQDPSLRAIAPAPIPNHAVQDGAESEASMRRNRVRFRFLRLGREGWRWGRALRYAEKRGWVRRDEAERHGWAWVGAVPSEAAAASTTATATATISGTAVSEKDGEEERSSVV